MSDPDAREPDERLEAALRERLSTIRAPLSPAVEGRLRAARRTALAALDESPSARGHVASRRAERRRLAAMGGAAIAASVAWLALRGLGPSAVAPSEAPPPALLAIDARDWPLLADAEAVGFYDDIEFWFWLDETDADARDRRG